MITEKLIAQEAIHSYAIKKISDRFSYEIRDYLKKERGYDVMTIKSMNLGYIDSKRWLGKFLKDRGFSDDQVKEGYRILHSIGKSHQLLIPFRNKEGDLIGFAARNINYKETDKLGKYLYTKGLSRNSSLLCLDRIPKEQKNIVVVEGMLDALHAQAKGMSNVVALGGTGFNTKQLRQLKDHGITDIAIALDNDMAGREAANKMKALIHKYTPEIKTRDISLPHGIKDLDQLISKHGIDGFKSITLQTHEISKMPNVNEDIVL
jgi:DNA primase